MKYLGRKIIPTVKLAWKPIVIKDLKVGDLVSHGEPVYAPGQNYYGYINEVRAGFIGVDWYNQNTNTFFSSQQFDHRTEMHTGCYYRHKKITILVRKNGH